MNCASSSKTGEAAMNWYRENRWLWNFLIAFGGAALLALWFLFHAKSGLTEASAQFTESATERNRLVYLVANFFDRAHVSIRCAGSPIEGAERADHVADVRVIDVAIDDVRDDRIAVLSPSLFGGKPAKLSRGRGLVEIEGRLPIQPGHR